LNWAKNHKFGILLTVLLFLALIFQNTRNLRYDFVESSPSGPMLALGEPRWGEFHLKEILPDQGIQIQFLFTVPSAAETKLLFSSGEGENVFQVYLQGGKDLWFKTGYRKSYPYGVRVSEGLIPGAQHKVRVLFENVYPQEISFSLDGKVYSKILDANIRPSFYPISYSADEPGFDLVGRQYQERQLFKIARLLLWCGIFALAAKLLCARRNEFFQLHSSLGQLPKSFFLLLGFGVVSLFTVFYPIFLQDSSLSRFFDFVPQSGEILGCDLRSRRVDFLRWWASGVSDSPLLEKFVFLPFGLLEQVTAYRLLVGTALVSNLFNTFLFAGLMLGYRRLSSSSAFLTLASFFSFGFLFELQQGQFYSFLFMMTLSSFWIYFRHPHLRWLSYLLISLAIQVKVVPIMFIVLLCDDFSNWKKHLKFVFLFGLLNFLPLILTNWHYFKLISNIALGVHPITLEGVQNIGVLFYQVSIKGFLLMFSKVTGLATPSSLPFVFYGLVLLVLGYVLRLCCLRRVANFSGALYLLVTISVLLLPADSIIYKLPMFTAAFLFYWENLSEKHTPLYLKFCLPLLFFWGTLVNGYGKYGGIKLDLWKVLLGHSAIPLLLIFFLVAYHFAREGDNDLKSA